MGVSGTKMRAGKTVAGFAAGVVIVTLTGVAPTVAGTKVMPTAATVVDRDTIPFLVVENEVRGTNVDAATNLGYLYTTSVAGDVTHARLFYKSFTKANPLPLGSPPHGWLNTANETGSKASMYTVGGVDVYTYMQTCQTGGKKIVQKRFTPQPGTEDVTVTTSVPVDCDNTIWNTNEYLGWSGSYYYFSEYTPAGSGWQTKLNRLDTATPNPNATHLQNVGNFGEQIDAFEADQNNLLVAYSNAQELYNGSPGRVAYIPSTSTGVTHDSSIIGRYNSGGLGLIALNPAGAVWSQNAPNGSSTQIVVYRRAAQTSHTYSGRLPGLRPTSPLATVSDTSGNVWLAWTDNSKGEDSSYWGHGKLNALLVTGNTQTVWSTHSAGQLMPTSDGRLVAYTPTDLNHPTVSTFTITPSSADITQTVPIDALPAPVFALGTSNTTLWAFHRNGYLSGGYKPSSWKYATAGMSDTGAVTRYDAFKPDVNTNSDVMDQGGNVNAIDATMTFVGRNENNPNVWSGVNAVTADGKTLWGQTVDGGTNTFLTGISTQASGWAYNESGSYKGRYAETSTGTPRSIPEDAVASTIAGGVYYYAPNGQIGYVNRGYTNTSADTSSLIPVDLTCTIKVEAAYGNYLLYDCAGTQKLAELVWNGSGFTATTTALPSTDTKWRLGDGYLAYRKQSGVMFEFGVRDIATQQDTVVDTVNNYDTTYGDVTRPAPQFTTDLTGGHRLAYADGDQNIHVVTINAPTAPSPDLARVATPTNETFTPNGNGVNDTWTANIVWDRQPSVWRFTVRNATTGKIEKTFTGPAATVAPQTVTVTWNGANDQGGMVADGTYLWVLESTPVNDVQTTVQTGNVTVRNAGTKPVTTVPYIATSDMIPVTVTTDLPVGVTGWQPYYQTLTNNANGTVNVSPWVMSGTASADRTIYVKVPRNVKANVKLVPNDTLGEPVESDPTTTIVPADGKDLKTTKKWANSTVVATPQHYMNTLYTTKKSKAKIVYTVNGPGKVVVTGVKNAKQGHYLVWVDGKKTSKKPRVAYSKTPVNGAVLYESKTFGKGKHTVTLQNHVSATKKWKKRTQLTVDSAYLVN